jgi:hypothetical protein
VLRRDLTDLGGEIARLYPVPAQRAGVPATPSLTAAEAERFRLFESLDTWLGRMAARHPALLVLDDLQWADESSLLLLPHLMRATRSTPLLVVAMYRDIGPERSEFAAALPSLARDIDCRRLTLRGLEHDAVTALLETVLAKTALPDTALPETALPETAPPPESAVIAELERETAGNPFYLLAMARHLSEGGAFGRDAGSLAATAAVVGIPESVRDMVRARLGRLSPECAEMLAMASLIGERFDASLLASAAALEETVTIAQLEEAARAGLVAETDDDADYAGDTGDTGGALDYWRFSHSLTRRVTAEELSRSRRARLHHRIGETLETRPGVPPAQLAHHFGAAAKGAAEKAVGYERLAGERALREVAAEVAVRHFRKALELLDRFGTGDQLLRCEVLLQLADAHDRAGEYAARDDRFAEAAGIAGALGNTGLFLRAALRYGGVLPANASPDPRAQALLTEALRRADTDDSAAKAMASARLAHWLHSVRPYPERRDLSDQSVAMARGTGDRRTLATVLLHRCFALDGPDDVGDALAVAGEIATISAELNDPELRLDALRIRLGAQFEKGEHSAATATARDLGALAQRVGHPEFIRLAAMWDVTLASLEGRFPEAEELGVELDRRLARLGHPQADIIPVAQTFTRRWLQGNAAEYIPVFDALSASAPGNRVWQAATAWSLAEAGARDRAAMLLREIGPEAAAEADKNYLWWAIVVGLADAAELTGDRPWARALYDLAEPYAGSNCTLGVAVFLGAVDHWLGVLAGVAGRHDDAARHLSAALERHQQMGAPPWVALTQEAYGVVLSRRGQPGDAGRAATLAQAAARTAGELGLAAITGRSRLRAGQLPRAGLPRAGLPRAEEADDPRVHVDGGPAPDDRVEVRVPVEYFPVVVPAGVVLLEPAQRLQGSGRVEDVVLRTLQQHQADAGDALRMLEVVLPAGVRDREALAHHERQVIEGLDVPDAEHVVQGDVGRVVQLRVAVRHPVDRVDPPAHRLPAPFLRGNRQGPETDVEHFIGRRPAGVR